MNTLLLDTVVWDLLLDASGNIAMATDPYSVVQDVATACRVFVGDLYYDTTAGVPYLLNILGQLPSANFIKSQLVAQALTVPGCTNPVVFLAGLSPGRVLTGQVQFTDANGMQQVAAF